MLIKGDTVIVDKNLWLSENDLGEQTTTELILGLRPANERRRYKVTPSSIG